MKVLSIGNSFSTDAHRYLHELAHANGLDIETANLFIGGCDLETHWKNLQEKNTFYDYEINGNEGERKISINQALREQKWDIITFQQVSGLSGIKSSFEPYLTLLSDFVRTEQPEAEFFYHQTWAYETDSLHPDFSNYNCSQSIMHEAIASAAKAAASSINANLIPVGEVIYTLRTKTAEFDYSKSGLSLCRDGFHLSFDYGRFAAAATWLKTLSGKRVEANPFKNLDPKLAELIIGTVNNSEIKEKT